MDAIADLNEEGFRRRPAPGSWNAAEILAHLLATEAHLAGSIERALSEATPRVAALTDDDRAEHARQAQRMPVPQIVHGLLARRRDTLRLLDSVDERRLARGATHPRWGTVSVAYLFGRIAEHEQEHAAGILSMRPEASTAGHP
jgi:uncharacterized damage-inducible protein DinB